MKKKVRYVFVRVALFVTAVTVFFVGCQRSVGDEAEGEGADKPDKIRLDYAYYSPVSLVLKEKGWAEEVFAEEGIDVEFVLSLGSNKALEFLNSNSVDFGSSAGAAALIAKSNGTPIETVYVYSKPEWTALVTNADSDIQHVGDLKGKKVAATIGTDPYIFLLRALNEEGLSAEDVEVVPLQHPDGATALSKGEVDAWAGLDPHMAQLELEEGAHLFYRNPEFNTYGFLSVRSEFKEKYPQYVEKVIELYEKARKWTLDHPADATRILADSAQLNKDVAEIEMGRNDFSDPVPGAVHREAIKAAAEVLQSEGIIGADVDIDSLSHELIQPSFAEKVVQ